ncbi:MAG: hypothetical protein KGR26_06720, partial [Cyanobacteria bacterium REEB65]|nr:hypothetical protein [Cyanobacteria bacterium REEB65]
RLKLALHGLLAAATVGSLASPAAAIPTHFGSPFNPPRSLGLALLEAQVQSDRSWNLSLGGAYGITRHIAATWSLEHASSGDDLLGLGLGTAGEIGGFFARFGLSGSKSIRSGLGPSYALTMDWGRPLAKGLSTFGELSGGLAPTASPGLSFAPGFTYNQALELALASTVSLDFEYLGGVSAAGRSEFLCADLSAALGRTFWTATVMLPRSPQATPPLYLLSTAVRLWPLS